MVLTATFWSRCFFFSYFTDEETEAQRSLTTCPSFCRQVQHIAEPGYLVIISKVTFTPRLAAFIAWEQGLISLTLSYPGVRSIARTPNHSKLSQQSVY